MSKEKYEPILWIFSDIGDHLHYEEISSIFLIYRNLLEAKYEKDLHWVGEWDKTSEERRVLSTPFTTIPFVQSFLLYRRLLVFLRSIESREGKLRGCIFPFPSNFRNGTWSIVKLYLSRALALSSFSFVCVILFAAFLRQWFDSRSKVKVRMSFTARVIDFVIIDRIKFLKLHDR